MGWRRFKNWKLKCVRRDWNSRNRMSLLHALLLSCAVQPKSRKARRLTLKPRWNRFTIRICALSSTTMESRCSLRHVSTLLSISDTWLSISSTVLLKMLASTL
uniref:(northern house mosquito) hypothetical protein n=1 Tax=Culex pipiens TaxID=7175 RepID=A0A8D8NSJ7_CULPI